MKILPFILLLLVSNPAILGAAEIEPSICGSEADAQKFRTLAGGQVEVLAVCPKKGYSFVEILGEETDIEEFKSRIEADNSNVTVVTDWIAETSSGSRVLMVEFKTIPVPD